MIRSPAPPLVVAVLLDGSVAMTGVAATLAELARVQVWTEPLPGAALDVVVTRPYPAELPAPVRWLVARQRVLAFGGDLGRPEMGALLRAGFRGYVAGDARIAAFVEAVRAVAANALYYPDPCADLAGGLTAREQDLLRLVSAALTHKEIARRLGLSKLTIDTYVGRMRRKLGVNNKAGLVRAAAEYGLL
jgi:DNA-binding CsgD family transcriptional regulator